MATLETSKKFRKPVLLTAGIIGTIQAVGWICFSVLSILCYNEVIDVSEGDQNLYEYCLYHLFHGRSYADIAPSYVIVKPLQFDIFMYFYSVLSFLWLCNSSFLVWGMIRNKWSKTIVTIRCWVILTVSISLLDLILTCLLAVDFHNIFSDYKTIDNADRFGKMAFQGVYGIVISLAARGYVLWIVNVVFCFVLANYILQMQKEDVPSRFSYIDAYATKGIPKFDTGKVNEGFVPDNSETSERSSSYNPLSVSSSLSNDNILFSKPNVEYPRNPEYLTSDNVSRQPTVDRLRSYTTEESFQQSPRDQPIFDRVAKIGKIWGRRTPPQTVSPPSVPKMPFIPDPDYTPPSSPRNQPKSVLRSNSKYTY